MVRSISVVMPNFNKRPFLEEAVASVLAQEAVDVELLVVDDASTDGSFDVLLALETCDPRIRVHRMKERCGANVCRNVGLRLSAHDVIMFMDSDDLLGPSCLARRCDLVGAYPGFEGWVFPMVSFVRSPEKILSYWRPKRGSHLNLFLAHRLPWSIMQAVWRKSFVTSVGGFDPDMERLQDVEFHTRALMAGARIHVAEGEADCFYRRDPSRRGMCSDEMNKRVSGAIMYMEKLYNKLDRRERRRLLLTALYVVDAISVARRCDAVTAEFERSEYERVDRALERLGVSRRARACIGGLRRARLAVPWHVRGMRWLIGHVLLAT